MTTNPAAPGRNAAEEAAVDRIAELLLRQIGLRPEPNLRGRLRRSIRDEAAAHGGDPGAFENHLMASPSTMQSLINRVTVQETNFFRHPEHFEVLARDILPTVTQPVTIWSAGCSNGQEAYSLAMLLEEMRIAGAVVATDLSTSAVKRTASGKYAERELTGLSPERTARHMTETSSGWRVNDKLRSRVTTMQHNLLDPIPEIARPSKIVFCRNVLIYFSRDHARSFVHRVADAMPEAAFFLGSAEAMWPISHRFETVHTGETFYYRLRSAVSTSPETARPEAGSRKSPQRSLLHQTSRYSPAVRTRPELYPGVVRSDDSRGSSPRPETASRTAVRPARTGHSADRAVPDAADAAALNRVGQQALEAGDYAAAVVAFRKCAYLAPDSPVAHLHLGLALEATGDLMSARRAFRAARRAVLHPAGEHAGDTLGGYATSELLRLLDAKQQVTGR
jgi:chemotaxis protein methyltransferase CheR